MYHIILWKWVLHPVVHAAGKQNVALIWSTHCTGNTSHVSVNEKQKSCDMFFAIMWSYEAAVQTDLCKQQRLRVLLWRWHLSVCYCSGACHQEAGDTSQA